MEAVERPGAMHEAELLEPGQRVGRTEGGDRRGREPPPDDRRPLRHGPLVRWEPVEAAGEQRLDRGRDGLERVRRRLHYRRHELLDVERIALGDLDDAVGVRFVAGKVACVLVRQRLEHE